MKFVLQSRQSRKDVRISKQFYENYDKRIKLDQGSYNLKHDKPQTA